MQKKKKKWSRPQLIVLVRGKPEERMLVNCKAIGVFDAMGGYSGCKNDNAVECLPSYCETLVSS